MLKLLYGLHDIEGSPHVPSGGWCLDLAYLSESEQGLDYRNIKPDINWLVRLNWADGGGGTIPKRDQLSLYVNACGRYAQTSRGVHAYIIGNEPNHENERPDGIVITPEHYVECFTRARDVIKNVSPDARVFPAPLAPYHASPIDWLHYWRTMLSLIVSQGGCDGLALHAYPRGSTPDAVTSNDRMTAPLLGQFNGFRTYRDALGAVPASLRGVEVHITEIDENLPGGWVDANTGIVKAIYNEINEWNGQSGTQKIQSGILYRWPPYDKWYIQGKLGVIQDFNEACQNRFQSPNAGQQGPSSTILVPSIKKEPETPNTAVFKRSEDPRAKARGVSIVEMPFKGNEPIWKVVKTEWLDETQSQGRHHIYFETLDENGNRLVGIPILVAWPTGSHTVYSEEKKGEPYSANYPMSPSRNEFSAIVFGQGLSEMVRGIGMGADSGSGFNAGAHTSTVVTFQRLKGEAPLEKPPVVAKPTLVHPVQDSRFRVVTQGWGEHPENYSRFSVDGVPLRGHNGIDFGTPLGSIIQAVDFGKVVEAANDPEGYGNYIKLVHSWGESLYAHLSVFNVRVGDQVGKGSMIGLSGNTGNSTGPHLHFSIRVNPYNRRDGMGGYTNPMQYLVEPTSADVSVMTAIRQAATETGLEWELLASLAWAESSFRPEIPDGLFQIGDATWGDWSGRLGAKNRNNALDNARVGAHYLKWLIGQLNNNTYQALVAYNFGIGNVLDDVEAPLTTYAYVNKVLHGRDLLKAVE